MRELGRLRVPIVTSLGVGAHLERFGVDPAAITQLDWWETHTLPGGRLAFTATPAQHFSGRGLGRNATLWSSWVVQADKHRLFFSGDTGLTDEFTAIGERFGGFDVTMLEIGAFHPAWGGIHLGPENALRAFDMLGGGTLMPVHWGTFDSGPARVGRAGGNAGHARRGTRRARAHSGPRTPLRTVACRGCNAVVARTRATRGKADDRSIEGNRNRALERASSVRHACGRRSSGKPTTLGGMVQRSWSAS